MCCEYIASVKASWCYLVDPVIESGHTSENSRLLHSVTAQTRNEAGNTMHLPDAGRVLTVQGTARVTLRDDNKKLLVVDTQKCVQIFFYTMIQYLNLHNIPRPFVVTLSAV